MITRDALFFDIAKGHNVSLKTTDANHYSEKVSPDGGEEVAESFKDMLNGSIKKVNDLQVNSEELTRKMIYEPESVDVHTVMIAAQKAEVSLTFAKTIRDEAIKAYRELMNLR